VLVVRFGVSTFLLVLCSFLNVEARIINVPSEQSTIQAGIDAAASGDTVLVARGTFYENLNLRGRNIVLASRYLSTRDLADIDSTVINGANAANDTGSCLLIVSGEDSTAIVEGFTITRGSGTPWTDEHGAGLFREGGGILIALSSPTIRHNVIANNSASNRSGVVSAGGGGIRVGDGNPLIESNVIVSNTGRYGAGLVLNYTGARVRNNVFYDNRGGQDYGGGGIWAYAGFAAPKVFENNTIVNNASNTNGGGIRVWGVDSVVCVNNVFWNNSSPSGAQIFDDGGIRVRYSGVQGGWPGVGNIDAEPAFAENNYLLTPASPCVDAGDPATGYNDPDSSGVAEWPALGGLRNDMGAYGGPLSAVLATTFAGIEERPGSSLPRPGLRVWPQPARDVLFIDGPGTQPRLPGGNWVMSGAPCLLDAAGRKVRDLRAGANDVSGLVPGVYFAHRAIGAGAFSAAVVIAE
jgi:hypothetical protein